MTEPMTGIAAGAELGAVVVRASSELHLGQKALDFFRKKQTLIFLGSTGTGKTNMIASLEAAAAPVAAIDRNTRTEMLQTHKGRIENRPYKIIDTPGQEAHFPELSKKIMDAMAHPPVRVINVASYGYHEYVTDTEDAVDPATGEPRSEFLARHREEELNALRMWVPLLGNSDTTKWVFTAITKADLWWKHQSEVINYYKTGEYAQLLKSKDQRLRHVVLPYCSVAHMFYGVAPIDGTFDDVPRLSISQHFLSQLINMD